MSRDKTHHSKQPSIVVSGIGTPFSSCYTATQSYRYYTSFKPVTSHTLPSFFKNNSSNILTDYLQLRIRIHYHVTHTIDIPLWTCFFATNTRKFHQFRSDISLSIFLACTASDKGSIVGPNIFVNYLTPEVATFWAIHCEVRANEQFHTLDQLQPLRNTFVMMTMRVSDSISQCK